MNNWQTIPSNEVLEKTAEALRANGINVTIAETAEEAKKLALEMIPEGAEVMNMTSITVEKMSLATEINESGKFDSVKNKLANMNRETENREMQRIGAAPEYTVGSVHAITENGQVMIASNTGSQLPAYVYGSPNVIWIAGAQKIVKDMDEGLKRMGEYILPLETERAKKAYGLPDDFKSNVSKVLIINREVNNKRLNLIIVKEILGF